MDSSTLRITLSLLAYDYSGGAFGSFGSGILRAIAALSGLSGMLDQLSPTLLALLGTVAVSGAAFGLFADGLYRAITAGAQLQQAGVMASIAISDGSKHVGELEAAIVNLANTSQYKIADVDMAFRVLGGLGFTTGQILGGLGQQAIILAQAMGGPGAGVSAADAAQLLGQAIYLFGQRGLTAKVAADELTGAFYSNMMSVSDLTSFLGMAGGTAASLGVSFGQLLTFGSMLTPMFGSASSAGASLSYMMRNLAHPATQKMADEIQSLGLHVYDAQGQFVGLKSIMDQLFQDTAGMTEQQKMDVFGTLFNVRSGRAAMDLMSQTQASFDAMYDRVNTRIQQNGQAQKDSDAINNTVIGTWQRLTTTLNDFFAKAGEGIGTALLPLMNAFNGLLSVMQANPALMQFIGVFLLLGTIITGLTFIITAGIVVFSLFGAAIAAIFLPVTLVTGAILALGALVLLAWNNWTGFRQVVEQVGAALGTFAGEVVSRLGPIKDNIVSLLGTLKTDWDNNWASIRDFLTPIWNDIESITRVGWAITSGIVKVGLDVLGGNWKQGWSDMKDSLHGIWDQINQDTTQHVLTLQGTTNRNLTNLWNGIISINGDGMMRWTNNINQLLPKTGDTFKNFFSGLANDASHWGENIMKNLANGIQNGINNFLRNALSNVGGLFSRFVPHSPVEEGPLRDLELWGSNITMMLAKGMVGNRGAISGAFTSLFTSPGVGQAQGSVAGTAGQAITVQLQLDDKTLAEAFFTYTNGQMRQNGYTRTNR